MNILGGMKILWTFWGGGSLQNWTIFWGRFYAVKGLFLRSMYTMRDILGGCLNFKYFWGA